MQRHYSKRMICEKMFLDFDAKKINEHKVNGPFYLWDLYIYNTSDTGSVDINRYVIPKYLNLLH